MAIGPDPKDEDITPGLLMFGVVTINGRSRPVLQKQATEEDACTDCGGYGHSGNPLCGAIYRCESCDGSGLRQPGQPPYVPKKDEPEVINECPRPKWRWWPVVLLVVVILLISALN